MSGASATVPAVIAAGTPLPLGAAAADLPFARTSGWLQDYALALRVTEQGSVVSVGDGIAWISGLPSAAVDEVLYFGDGSRGIVFDLERDLVGAVLLHQTQALTASTTAYRGHRQVSVPAGDALLGRVVDPLGAPLDAQPPPQPADPQPLDAPSPPMIRRRFVSEPLFTGIKIIDGLIPVGRGQRQLIVGDKGLGRSALAIDAVLAQADSGVRCVYVMIGQKRSSVVGTIDLLRDHGALDYTTVVVGEASALPGLKHLAPFAGCAIAEYWMARGIDTLVVYDDLSAHAQAYRELSLLLRRPPGREAYPGDIFFLHAKLLERATRLAEDAGGGSQTAIAIVETRLGEIASYIPTNLISISDGQIYLDRDLFSAGFLPAIDIARSVSRIGGKAQPAAIKREAGRTKLDYLQFLELEVFTRFGARLEAGMEQRLKRGAVLRELLRQDRLDPLPIRVQLALLIAYNAGLLDELTKAQVPAAEKRLRQAVAASPLTMSDTREAWLAAIAGWLEVEPAAEPGGRSGGESGADFGAASSAESDGGERPAEAADEPAA
ncbi:MAG: F0F1 ATP synthase subunit alpha [Thiohalocapsa sp.]|jgi:F-type H+-transporting ATPase subunit alpha|uniref:F0F1 ATP synthase subunit alpha n=1 Tax=Thiohalocapsa sp. TaxID=2497641 RepID=UPI0025EA00A6|nr:F0F1 ATP synthase subunit alpha [Thiohalocapsa sp.]MCG6942661.1 F0F1 ATP synthase subunit alpha [Thiohalocapsa sp.]